MKKLLSLCFCLVPLTCFGQYADDNSTMRKALVLYELDNNGFYKKKTNVFIGYLSDVVNTYAYVTHMYVYVMIRFVHSE